MPHWQAGRPCPDTPLAPEALHAAQAAIRARHGQTPTPLVAMPGLARALELGRVLIKDEGARFGLGGVKALGAPYALDRWIAASGLAAAQVTAVAATDGNHGLALAWQAQQLGCRARIFVGTAVDAPRRRRITDAGAMLTVIDGNYDDAVAAAAAYAACTPGAALITDTDLVGDLPVTRDIMAGYSLLGAELHQQLGDHHPSHWFVPAGVGGVAAGIAAGWWQLTGVCPHLVTVEPARAASLLASLASGQPGPLDDTLDTRMIGLACGEPSRPAWEILRQCVAGAITAHETTSAALQTTLADGFAGDPPLHAGDTGIAALAGLVDAARDPDTRRRLGLGPDSTVLVLVSEGPLPDHYRIPHPDRCTTATHPDTPRSPAR